MDYSGKKINNRLVQICVLTEYQKYAWTKLPDVCQYEGKKKTQNNQRTNKVKHIYFRHYRIGIDHKV